MTDQQETNTTDLRPFDAQRDRAIGALVGLAVGDALGTAIEFSPRDTYSRVTDMIGGGPFRLKAGEWTDDTSMALCLADSLIANGGILEPTDLAHDSFVGGKAARIASLAPVSISATPHGAPSRASLRRAGRSAAKTHARPATAASCASRRLSLLRKAIPTPQHLSPAISRE